MAYIAISRPYLASPPRSSELPTHRSRHRQRRVHIRKESLRILLDLPHLKPLPRIRSTSRQTRAKRPSQTSHTPPHLPIGTYRLRIRERDARRTGLALRSLVDVRGRERGGLVLALEIVEGDVVADCVLVGVEAEEVEAFGAGEAAGGGVVGIDDLVWGSENGEGGGEVEGGSGWRRRSQLGI